MGMRVIAGKVWRRHEEVTKFHYIAASFLTLIKLLAMAMNRMPKHDAPEIAPLNPKLRLPAAVVKHAEGAWKMSFNDLSGTTL